MRFRSRAIPVRGAYRGGCEDLTCFTEDQIARRPFGVGRPSRVWSCRRDDAAPQDIFFQSCRPRSQAPASWTSSSCRLSSWPSPSCCWMDCMASSIHTASLRRCHAKSGAGTSTIASYRTALQAAASALTEYFTLTSAPKHRRSWLDVLARCTAHENLMVSIESRCMSSSISLE